MTMTTNLKQVSRKMDKLMNKLTSTTLKQALHLALQLVGFKAVSRYMVQTAGIMQAAGMGVNPEKLTIRTGRLAGSIVNAPRFSIADLPTDIEMLYLKETKGRTVARLGGIQESINEVKRSGLVFEAIKGSKVPYAKKHEKGISVTARPYLTPAAMESRQEIINILERTIIHQGRIHSF